MSIAVLYHPEHGLYTEIGDPKVDLGGANLENCNYIGGTFTGSLTCLQNGTAAFIAGPNVTISTGSSGAVTFTGLGFGRTIRVDGINGNDSSGARGIGPFKTINAAVNVMTSGDTVWISPGTYELSAPITLPANSSIRGMSLQTTTIQMTNVTSSLSMITMGENCRLEDLTISLSSNEHHDLTALLFPGTTSVTSKLRTAVVTVDNDSASLTGSSNICAVKSTGSGSLGDGNFSFNSLKGSTINVRSIGSGSKNGICLNGPNALTIRDVNVYVSGVVGSAGEFIGVMTMHSASELQMRTSSIFGTTADISQNSGSIIVGPGTDIINRNANGKPFTTYVYPTTVAYGAIGDLTSSNSAVMYLTPGSNVTQPGFSTGGKTVFPYPPSYRVSYALEQKAVILGLSVSSSVGPGTGVTNIYIEKNGVKTEFTGSITDGILYSEYRSGSLTCNRFDLISLRVEMTGSANTTQNLICQINLF